MTNEQRQPKLGGGHYFEADKSVGPDGNIETAPVTGEIILTGGILTVELTVDSIIINY